MEWFVYIWIVFSCKKVKSSKLDLYHQLIGIKMFYTVDDLQILAKVNMLFMSMVLVHSSYRFEHVLCIASLPDKMITTCINYKIS